MLLSPGVETKEASLQTTVVNSSTGRAAMVGKFRWGPAYEVSQVVSEVDLVDRFDVPDANTADSFFSGANFLKYGNDLRMVRVLDPAKAKNASALFETIEVTITNAGTGYQVGDSFTVQYGSDTIATGHVSMIEIGGAIKQVYIPSAAIVDKAKETGTYPAMGDWTISAVSTEAGGSSASLTSPKIRIDAGVYFPNDDFAIDALTSTDSGKTKFNDVCSANLLPSIAARFAGEFGDGITVDILSYKAFTDPLFVTNGVCSLPIIPTGGVKQITLKAAFPYGLGPLEYINGTQTLTPECIALLKNRVGIIVSRGGEVLESVVLSLKPGDTDVYGTNIFIDDYFENGLSRYISGTSKNWPDQFAGSLVLGGGTSGNEDVSTGEWQKGWDLFEDRNNLRVQLLIAGACAGMGQADAAIIQKYVSDLADKRQDCLTFVSPPRELVVNKEASAAIASLVEWRNTVLNINSTYATIDGNYKFQYDKYNDVNRWVPLSADIAGLCARTDVISQPWMSPAGFTRGQIQGVIKLAIETRQSHRDLLYEASINPVVSFSGQGVILYGDKTATSQPSPFDRINVRRLFNLVKASVSNTAQYKLFELNDAYTQMSFRSEVNSYLDGIKSLGGMYDFRVICDGSNNTPAVVDRNEFVATVMIKPARSINFIILNFQATATGANFDELIGKA